VCVFACLRVFVLEIDSELTVSAFVFCVFCVTTLPKKGGIESVRGVVQVHGGVGS